MGFLLPENLKRKANDYYNYRTLHCNNKFPMKGQISHPVISLPRRHPFIKSIHTNMEQDHP